MSSIVQAKRFWYAAFLGIAIWGMGFGWTKAAAPQTTAQEILEGTGVRGGLVVHLGCGDGRLTAALATGPSYVVQGLDRDPACVAAARDHIQSQGLYGRVTVIPWRGDQLPYIDNLVNLLVAEDLQGVSMDEVLRVLVPGGVAYVKQAGRWTKTLKPFPSEIDEWTHYLHDPTNNAVAHDTAIGPPRRYQWIAGPRYSRQHDHMSNLSAMVSAGGRVFYIFDESPRASILTPPEWRLIARDAFNGTLLWKRDISVWHPHLWRLKSGPQLLTRRLVASDGRVFVTLGIDAPVSVLDAATGETLRTLEQTRATEEILYLDGMLVLSVAAEGQPLRSDPERRYTSLKEMNNDVTNPLWTEAPRTVMAVDAESGRVVWKHQTPLVSMSLAADARRVVFHDGQRLECLDRLTGQRLWSSDPLPVKRPMRSSGGATVVIYDDVVLYSGQVAAEKRRQRRSTTMFALSADNGKTLWQARHAPCGHMGTPDDILVVGGLVWSGAVAQGSDSGVMTGRDLHTGEVKAEFPPDVQTHWFHHRCYRAKATDKYLLFSRTGIEFIDYAREHWICHHWVRGACLYGILPANGLIYAPQHPCACYIEAKLYGLSVLAPASDGLPQHQIPGAERLQRGPAYGQPLAEAQADSDDWPTFRHDAARSGTTRTAVPARGLATAWNKALGGKLTSPVVAGGRLFVASVDSHTLHALDAGTGEPVWQFTAGGRIDSPPTLWKGRVLFGSADGYVYCLTAGDGQLVWRYRAAPEERQMGAWDQIESVWPVHGSVLVQNDVLYCVAGRSMFLDGGLRLLRLDPATGKKLSETILDDRDPQSGQNLQVHVQGLNMPVALPDVLSSDGRYVYMRSLPFHLDGRRKYVGYVDVKDQQGDDRHLFCPTGFLDDSLWHRTYWGYGRAWASGAGGYYRAGRLIAAGRPLVVSQHKVYGFGRLWKYYRWTTPLEYHLFATDKEPEVVKASTERRPVRKKGRRVGTRTVAFTRFATDWSVSVPVQATAMVLAGDVLFVAGPPDVVDEEEAVRALADPEIQEKLAEQRAAYEGRLGGLLLAVDPKDGQTLSRCRLDHMPRFDGLIAARGKLYMTTADGHVLCLAGQ